MTVIEYALAIAYPFQVPSVFSRQILISCLNIWLSANGDTSNLNGCSGGQVDKAIAFTAYNTFSRLVFCIFQVLSQTHNFQEYLYPYQSGIDGLDHTCNTTMMSLPSSPDTWLEQGQLYKYDGRFSIASYNINFSVLWNGNFG